MASAASSARADMAVSIWVWSSAAASVTVADPQYRNLQNSSGADPSAVNGNQIIREPKFYANIRPSYTFEVGSARVDLFGKYEYVGERFVDFLNQTRMPAYGSVDAGISVTYNNAWMLQVTGHPAAVLDGGISAM